MKKFILFLSIACASLAFTSCSDDDVAEADLIGEWGVYQEDDGHYIGSRAVVDQTIHFSSGQEGYIFHNNQCEHYVDFNAAYFYGNYSVRDMVLYLTRSADGVNEVWQLKFLGDNDVIFSKDDNDGSFIDLYLTRIN